MNRRQFTFGSLCAAVGAVLGVRPKQSLACESLVEGRDYTCDWRQENDEPEIVEVEWNDSDGKYNGIRFVEWEQMAEGRKYCKQWRTGGLDHYEYFVFLDWMDRGRTIARTQPC